MQLGLGMVQFEIDYAVSNRSGKTSRVDVFEILNEAKKSNIDYLDIAPCYGDSEAVIGSYHLIKQFKTITKTYPINKNLIADNDINTINEHFERSLDLLHAKAIYGLLIHRAADLTNSGGKKIFECLQSIKNKGRVKKIGISVYPEDNIDLLLNSFEFDLIQLPLNVLD